MPRFPIVISLASEAIHDSETSQFTNYVAAGEVNSPPLLSTIPNRTIHAGSTFQMNCLAQDSNGETNALMFNFDESPLGASINPTNGVCSWPTTDADANTINSVAVRVTDTGEPPLSDTQEFSVTVMARPLIQSITITNAVATISWSAIAGQHYVLQSRPTLSAQNWSDVGGEVIGTGAVASQTNSIPATTSQFYRIRVVP